MTSIREDELLEFFEVKPSVSEGDEWPYGDFLYVVVRKPFRLSFSLLPAHKDVRILLEHEGRVIYEMNSTNIQDVSLDVEMNQIRLIITHQESLFVKVDPFIQIRHAYNNLN